MHAPRRQLLEGRLRIVAAEPAVHRRDLDGSGVATGVGGGLAHHVDQLGDVTAERDEAVAEGAGTLRGAAGVPADDDRHRASTGFGLLLMPEKETCLPSRLTLSAPTACA